MDVLLTQLYGMIMVLNMFGIVVAACMVYNMEFKGTAIKKMYMLPISVPKMYLCKFFILTRKGHTDRRNESVRKRGAVRQYD